MIPNFKTYLKESVWGDIRKKSLGKEERTEDSLSYLNDMNVDDFVHFLWTAYPSTPQGKKTSVSEWDNSNIIGFPIIIDNSKPASIFLYDYKKRKKWIGINSSFMTDYPDIISIIEKEYKTTMEGRKVIKIYKDDPYENINNMDFIKLIDYLIANIDTSKHTLARTERISESVWGDLRKKSLGHESREEDVFGQELIKIKKMGLIDVTSPTHLGMKLLWTPCNFGSESYDKPGLWLDRDQIKELNEYLKKTEYSIATEFDWKCLIGTPGKYVKLNNKLYSLVFGTGEDKLYIPNFGYMSSLSYPLYTRKNTSPIYGTMLYSKPAHIFLRFKYSKSNVLTSLNTESDTIPEIEDEILKERFQVRLVKRVS